MTVNLTKLRNEFLASDLLPFEFHYSRQSIKTENDTLLRIFAVDGLLFETADNTEINAWHEQLCSALLSIGIRAGHNAAIWHWIVKEQDSCSETSTLTHDFAKDFLRDYARQLNNNRFYRTRQFIAVCIKSPYRIPKFSPNKAAEAGRKAGLAESEEKLDEITAALRQLPHGITALSTYEHNGQLYSSPLEVLFRLLNGYWTPVPLYSAPIHSFLATSRLLFGRDVLEIRTPTEQIYGAALGFRQYLDKTHPLTMQDILRLPFPITLAQSFTFIESKKAGRDLAQLIRQLKISQDTADTYRDALEIAKEQLKTNTIFFGQHHLNLFVWVHSNGEESDTAIKNQLTERLSQASSILSQTSIIVAREDMALPSAFYATLPDNSVYRPRVARIHSRNFAGFAPLHTTPTGSDNSFWTNRDGKHEALMVFRNTSGGLYRFNPHVNEIPHGLIIGATRSGKSVLMAALASQFDKYASRVIMFDKDCGQEIFIRAMDGKYYNIDDGQPSGFNPYAIPHNLKDSKQKRAYIRFLTQFTLRLAYPNGDHTIKQDNELNTHLRAWYANHDLPIALRRLRELRRGLSDTELKERLLKWTEGGSHGWLFDNPEDNLDFDSQYTGIDTTDILEDPEAKVPFFMYLFFRIRLALDGRRTSILLDEMWKMLDEGFFATVIRDWLKTIAKKNGLLLGATQDAKDISGNEFSSAILTQCATRIFFPNSRANYEDYRHFSLTNNEFFFIQTANPKLRMILIKQETDSVLVDFKLNNMDDHLSVISGRPNNVRIMRECIKETSENPKDWMPLFLKRYVKE